APRFWDARPGQAAAALEGHTGPANSPAFSPDGRRIVTASGVLRGLDPPEDTTARVWDAAMGQQIAVLEGRSAAFSPDGQRIVTTSANRGARIWDATTGQQLAALEGD